MPNIEYSNNDSLENSLDDNVNTNKFITLIMIILLIATITGIMVAIVQKIQDGQDFETFSFANFLPILTSGFLPFLAYRKVAIGIRDIRKKRLFIKAGLVILILTILIIGLLAII